MVNRVLVAITLICFTISSIGCTKHTCLSFDEVRGDSDKRIRAIIFPESIAGVTLRSGEREMFRENTAIFDHRSNTITGVTRAGSDLEVTLDELAYVVIESMSIEGVKYSRLYTATFLTDSQERPWSTGDGRSFRAGAEIVFDDRVCEYNAENDMISWFTTDYERVEVTLNDVLNIVSTRTSFNRSTLKNKTIVNIPLYKFGEQSHLKVTSVTYRDGTRVVFDSRGGVYDPDNKTVAGSLDDGSSLTVKMRDVILLESVSTVFGDTLQSVESKDAFTAGLPDGGIIGVITKSQEVIDFDLQYGQLDTASKTISSLTVAGQVVEIPFADVLFVQMVPGHTSTDQIVWLIVACVAFAGMIYLISKIEFVPEIDLSGLND